MEILLFDFNALIDIISLICVGGALTAAGNATVGSNVGDLDGNDDLGVMIPALWASAIYRYFEKALVFKPFFDDYSSMVKNKGDTLYLPEIQETTVDEKSANTAVTYTTNVETAVTLLVDKHKYAAKLFEDIGLIQANEQLLTKYTKSMGYSLAKQVDTDIESALQSMQTGVQLGANNALSNAKAEEVYATLLENDIPPEECAWFVNPTLYADLVANAAFITAAGDTDVPLGFDESRNAARTGRIGSLFGMPVYMSPIISSASGVGVEPGYIAHTSCVAVAVQSDIRVQSEYSVDNIGTKVVADVIYGVKLTDSSNHIKGIRFNQYS